MKGLTMSEYYYDTVSFGSDLTLTLVATLKGLAYVGVGSVEAAKNWAPDAKWLHEPMILQPYVSAFNNYFAQHTMPDIPLDLQGTDFQMRVWTALRTIPAGETISYSELAKAIDQPDAIRAAASAVAKNPVLIAVPCHRVIQKDGTLGNYRGGQAMKAALIDLEKR